MDRSYAPDPPLEAGFSGTRDAHLAHVFQDSVGVRAEFLR
jgi:hypothetical protein